MEHFLTSTIFIRWTEATAMAAMEVTAVSLCRKLQRRNE